MITGPRPFSLYLLERGENAPDYVRAMRPWTPDLQNHRTSNIERRTSNWSADWTFSVRCFFWGSWAASTSKNWRWVGSLEPTRQRAWSSAFRRSWPA